MLRLLVVLVLTLTAPALAVDAPKAQDFPTFGFSVAPSEGWTALECAGPTFAAHWGLIDRASGKPAASLSIEVYPLEGKTVGEFAGRVGRPLGERTPETIKVADVASLLLRNRNKDTSKESMPIRMALVTGQGDLAYVIRLSAKDDAAEQAGAAALEKLRASWAFRTVEAPSAHLKLLEARTLPGKFRMSIPACMRPIDVPGRPQGGNHFAAINFVANGPACMINVDVVPEALGDGAQRRKIFSADARERFNLAAEPTWTELPGKPSRWMTSPIDMPRRLFSRASRMFYAVVDLGQTHVVILFSIDAGDAEAAAAWSAAADAIVRSIEPLPDAK